VKTKRCNPNEPQGPPPAWIEDFRKDIRAMLARTVDDTSDMFDPPEGEPFCDAPPDHVQAVFLQKRKPTRRGGGGR
jgi:hypothetical protein